MANKVKMLALMLLLPLLAAGFFGCGNDDDDNGGTDADTDADADADADADTDSDSDTDETEGELMVSLHGSSIKVWPDSSALEIGFSMLVWASGATVTNVKLDEVRVYFDDELFFTMPGQNFVLDGMSFNGVVELGEGEYQISYKYAAQQLHGFENHCSDIFVTETDVSYNIGQSLDTLVWGGTPDLIVNCY